MVPLSLIWLQGQFFKAVSAPVTATLVQTTFVPLVMILGVAGAVLWKEAFSVRDAANIYVVSTCIIMLGAGALWFISQPGLWRTKGECDSVLLIRTGLPLLWLAIMNIAMNWIDILMLGIWVEADDIGIYGIALRVAVLLSFLLTAVNSVVAPRFAAMHADGNHASLERLAQRSAILLLIVVSPVALFIMAFPELILGLFGPEFSGGANVLRVLTLGQFVNAVIGPVGTLLMMSGNEKAIRNNVVLAISINLVGNIGLIPLWGPMGAAASTAAALIIQNILLYVKARKALKINMLVFVP